jgi:hypothetical protein
MTHRSVMLDSYYLVTTLLELLESQLHLYILEANYKYNQSTHVKLQIYLFFETLFRSKLLYSIPIISDPSLLTPIPKQH